MKLKQLFTILCLLCTMASAHDFKVDGICYNITTSYEVEVTYEGNDYLNDYKGYVSIPKSVTYNGTTYSVTSIGDNAFYNCVKLEKVTFNDALEKIGGTILQLRRIGMPTQSLANVTATIGVLSEAACELSREKSGALIVVERNTKLGDYIKTGIELDAQLSCELLGNLFFNRSPLHDGAVIVRDGKIAAAGCILPPSPRSLAHVTAQPLVSANRATRSLSLSARKREPFRLPITAFSSVIIIQAPSRTICSCC